jgi:nucleoid DNA-binding protein
MQSIEQDEFFKKVALDSGLSDVEIVRNVFYGMIRTISRELRTRQIIKLPNWGTFLLRIYKSRKIFNVNDKSHISIPAKPVLKFVADTKVKRYFIELGSDGTVVK